jgi:predicted nucleic acid-binding protein
VIPSSRSALSDARTGILYAETSAILRWLLGGERGEEVWDALRGADRIAASRLTLAEARRVLLRLEAIGELPPRLGNEARAELAVEATRWDVVELSDPVWFRVEQRFPVEPLLTLDAIHLASALHVHAATGELAMLSVDERVLASWRALGLPEALPQIR